MLFFFVLFVSRNGWEKKDVTVFAESNVDTFLRGSVILLIVFENRLKKEDDFIFKVYEFDWMTTESKPAWNELIGYVKELVFELLRFIFTNMWPNCKIGLMYIII